MYSVLNFLYITLLAFSIYLQGLGEEGEASQFTVHKKDSESGLVVTLQSVAHTEKYVQICEGQVGANGTGDEHSELKVVEIESCVTFESVKTSGQYLAVQEDGTAQTVTELAPSAHFMPSSPVKQETAKEATPPADEAEDKADEKADEKADDKPEQQEEVEDKEQSPTES